MKKVLLALLLAILSMPLLAVDTSDAILVGTVTVTNDTGATITDGLTWFEMSTVDLADTSIIGSDTLQLEIKDKDGNEVKFQPGSGRSAVEMCGPEHNSGTFVNEKTDCNDVGTDDVTMFGGGTIFSIDDSFVVGGNTQFNRIWFDISTAVETTTSTPVFVWEYCFAESSVDQCSVGDDPADWQILDVNDQTDDFSKEGLNVVSFNIPKDTGRGINEVEYDGLGSGTFSYWVRARATAAGELVRVALATQVFTENAVVHLQVDSIAASESIQYDVFVGQSTSRTFHHFMSGHIVTAHDAAIVPTDDFEIEVKGYFYVTSVGGSDAQFVWKSATPNAGDFALKMNNGKFIGDAGGGSIISSNSFADGVYTIRFNNDVGGRQLFVDDVLEGSGAQVTSVTGTNDFNWTTFQTVDVMRYIEFIKLDVGGTEVIHYQLNDALTHELTNRDSGGLYPGLFDQALSDCFFPSTGDTCIGRVRGQMKHGFKGVFTTPFGATNTSEESPNQAALVDVVSDVTGGAEGTGFAEISNPSSGLPGFELLTDLAGKDYDPIEVGTQGLPISFLYMMILGVIMIFVMLATMIFTKSMLAASIAGGMVAMLFVSVGVVSPWFLMWFAIPPAIWLGAKGGVVN